MTEFWTMKVSCDAVPVADILYGAVERSLMSVTGFEEVSRRGTVVTLTGTPEALLTVIGPFAWGMQRGWITQIVTTPKES